MELKMRPKWWNPSRGDGSHHSDGRSEKEMQQQQQQQQQQHQQQQQQHRQQSNGPQTTVDVNRGGDVTR